MGKRFNGRKMSHCKPDKVRPRPAKPGNTYSAPTPKVRKEKPKMHG